MSARERGLDGTSLRAALCNLPDGAACTNWDVLGVLCCAACTNWDTRLYLVYCAVCTNWCTVCNSEENTLAVLSILRCLYQVYNCIVPNGTNTKWHRDRRLEWN